MQFHWPSVSHAEPASSARRSKFEVGFMAGLNLDVVMALDCRNRFDKVSKATSNFVVLYVDKKVLNAIIVLISFLYGGRTRARRRVLWGTGLREVCANGRGSSENETIRSS